MKILTLDKNDLSRFPLPGLKKYSATHNVTVLVRNYCMITHGITQFTDKPIDKAMILCEALRDVRAEIK